ncbi:MAG: hypothetical protein IT562_16570 [Alphaproteobacteria bacterium]|nr:hypothetical protein [Alphaproteobacteria bacterium]
MKNLLLAATALVALASPALAASDTACKAEWDKADANRDGVLTGAEADPYMARMATPPQDGRITPAIFMSACQSDRFTTAGATGGTAVSTQTAKTDPGAPLAGANSFTESQARDRIVNAGYSDVSGLRKDDQGIWRGTAKKNGAQTNVAVDYRGNVVAQ